VTADDLLPLPIEDVLPTRSCVVVPCPIDDWRRHDEVSPELLAVVREAAQDRRELK
jgi:hypothetical protein